MSTYSLSKKAASSSSSESSTNWADLYCFASSCRLARRFLFAPSASLSTMPSSSSASPEDRVLRARGFRFFRTSSAADLPS